MQLSKPKLTADFIKTFEEPIYCANIDLTEVDLKTFIIEENREDVKVIYEGFKDMVSGVDFEINDGVLNIKVLSREKSGISSARKLYSVFTMENKLSIYLPTHFKKYLINGENANIRINNLCIDDVNVNITNGSVKVKYCEADHSISVNSENAFVSLKSIKSKNINVTNVNGITKLRNTNILNDLNLNSENGVIHAKDIEAGQNISSKTNNGTIDFDDVYAKVVNISADTGIINYFNGNFNKDINVNMDVKAGIVRTNVDREEIH